MINYQQRIAYCPLKFVDKPKYKTENVKLNAESCSNHEDILWQMKRALMM